MRISTAMTILGLVPSLVLSQGPPGSNVVVDARVTAISAQGDTTAITYVVTNGAASAEQLFRFTVDAPSPVLRLSLPAPQGWSTKVLFGVRTVAGWAVLGDQMQPGEQSPSLTAWAIGLPGIVPFWAEGYYPPPVGVPSDTIELGDPLVANSVIDTTVGVVPFPGDLGAPSLLLRLDSLRDQACGGLGWITDSGVCSTLDAKLDSASAEIGTADTAGAIAQLNSFITELNGQHGTGLPVNDSAYWLLKVNAEYIVSRLD